MPKKSHKKPATLTLVVELLEQLVDQRETDIVSLVNERIAGRDAIMKELRAIKNKLDSK